MIRGIGSWLRSSHTTPRELRSRTFIPVTDRIEQALWGKVINSFLSDLIRAKSPLGQLDAQGSSR